MLVEKFAVVNADLEVTFADAMATEGAKFVFELRTQAGSATAKIELDSADGLTVQPDATAPASSDATLVRESGGNVVLWIRATVMHQLAAGQYLGELREIVATGTKTKVLAELDLCLRRTAGREVA